MAYGGVAVKTLEHHYFMPNRKTFDDREKVDHSSHSTQSAERGDLGATPDSPSDDAPAPPAAPGAANSPAAQPAGDSQDSASRTLHIRRRLRPAGRS
jgi:hypothetical protein